MRKTKFFWFYSVSFFKDDINEDLDFYVRERAYEKRASGKQPLQLYKVTLYEVKGFSGIYLALSNRAMNWL